MDGLGIDLGTANTVICHAQDGVIISEPSMMAFRAKGRRTKLLVAGREARALVGRTPGGLTVVRPLEDGVVTDLEVARRFLLAMLRRVAGHWWERRRLSVVMGVPVGSTTLDRRALLEVAEEAGVGKAVLIPEPVAGAMGCGFDPLEPRTRMVVDVGGGTSEVAAFSFGGLLAYRSCPVAGDEMTLAVYQHLREEHQLVVGELVAEGAKIAASAEESPSLVVQGRDAASGRARLVSLAVEEVVEAIKPVTESIIQTLAACLEDLPAQSMTDVMADGVLTIGGGSLLLGFDKLLEDAFGFSVRLAEQPMTCVAQGAALCLSRPEVLVHYAT